MTDIVDKLERATAQLEASTIVVVTLSTAERATIARRIRELAVRLDLARALLEPDASELPPPRARPELAVLR
jgi:hypothetical protein